MGRPPRQGRRALATDAFLPSGDKSEGVAMFFRADDRWMAFLRPADHRDEPTQTTPPQAIISMRVSS